MMRDVFRAIRENKLLVGLALFLLLAVGLAYWLSTREHTGPTGGSGNPQDNTVIIYGWETKVSEGVELGELISLKQQQALVDEISQISIKQQGEFHYIEGDIQNDIEATFDDKTYEEQVKFKIKIRSSGKLFEVKLDNGLDTVSVSEINS